MSSLELPPVVPVTAADRAAIQRFSCDRGTPWSRAIEVMVRNDLADALQARMMEAVGIWDRADLAAVAAFQKLHLIPSNWRLRLVATRQRDADRGFATTLIETVAERAGDAGASCLSGLVHRDNTKMIRTLGTLGAVLDRRPDDDENLGFVLAL